MYDNLFIPSLTDGRKFLACTFLETLSIGFINSKEPRLSLIRGALSPTKNSYCFQEHLLSYYCMFQMKMEFHDSEFAILDKWLFVQFC